MPKGIYKRIKPVSDKTKEKIRKKLIGNKNGKGGKGRKASEETLKKMRLTQLGEKGSNWQGGKSFEPYGLEFNKELKELVKARDIKVCQLCNEESTKKLCVHHIDYNKKNNNKKNLITLCFRCNSLANFDREFWKDYFTEIQNFNYILKEIFELKKSKALDYGNNWKIMGFEGLVYEMSAKIMRMWTLTSNPVVTKNESLSDTLKDLAVYALMAYELVVENKMEPDEKELGKILRRRFGKGCDTEDKIEKLLTE